jgi:ferredoxin
MCKYMIFYLEFNFNLLFKECVMAHKITDDCLSCGACMSECPVDAISEGEGKYEINAEICTDCGACVSCCPADAIVQ